MINCQNCGQASSDGSNFCRFCGSKFAHFPAAQQQPQPQRQQPPRQMYPNVPPRPYSWKTDEFNVPKKSSSSRDTRQIDRVRPIAGLPNSTAPMVEYPKQQQSLQTNQQARQMTSHGYRCPRCQTTQLPVITRKISAAGWITFALLLSTIIFCWIGLLIKEDVRVCPVCNLQVG